ncbi:TRIM7 ligase, partial [Cnemophilus loriae]|nr:TRIM7 ligase [Cnemophilus loriae]
GGGTAQSRPERGQPGEAEAAGHRRRLRRGNFRAKQHLEHLTEKLKLLGLEGGRGEVEQLCSWRHSPVTPKGGGKASSSSHEGPGAPGGLAAAPEEGPAHEDKERIRSDLVKLKKQREEILELKMSGERQCQEFLAHTEAEKQKVLSEFRRLRRFLKEQEMVLLVRLGELEWERMRRQEEEEAEMSGKVSLLDVLICGMEKELEQPPARARDSPRSASRWDTGSAPRATDTPELERSLQDISRQIHVLGETLGRFRVLSPSNATLSPVPAEWETLDPDTAHARLAVSRDRRGARWTEAAPEPPPSPRRFQTWSCVLARGGFAGGRHRWDVAVAGDGVWALGVARGSLPRAGGLELLRPESGVWALGRCGGRYRAFTEPPAPVPGAGSTGSTGRVRVELDYGRGRVLFYLAGGETPAFTFSDAAFGGQRVFPFFWV